MTTYKVVQQIEIELDPNVSVRFYYAKAEVVDALVAKYGRFVTSEQMTGDEWEALGEGGGGTCSDMTHQDLIVHYI